MGTLLKIIIFTAPILALVFWYVVQQQQKLDTKIEKESTTFDRDFYEQQQGFTGDKEQKEKLKQRAEKADKKIEEIEKREEESKKKLDKFEADFDKAMADPELKKLEKELK